ncbi:TonB-dependent receptor [Sphingobium aquiterrae]|uniref:TonB-dependent receptor n=1 Tax=Sphingobium aquiterrae TaxID=2038656 RepID=UPI00301962B2
MHILPYVLPLAALASPTVARDAKADGAEIIVNGRALPQLGLARSASQGTVGYDDFSDRPVARVGELVENVPGVIATQHSGSGKANQYFLRGFNLDHGADFAGFLDGVPLNLRTHGHGQGYLDLNVLIPEIVERIDYRKGPYFADAGDFTAAGTVQFTTAGHLPRPITEATLGSYGHARALAAGSSEVADGDLLVALEAARTDGPWILDEKFRKLNGFAKFSKGGTEENWSLALSAYHASWRATDQVPERAVESGLIGRFGAIDDALGGRTTRIGLTGNAQFGDTHVTLYATRYRLRLVSNFTYFLADPVLGDEFAQHDDRWVLGGALGHGLYARVAGIPVRVDLGAETRLDAIASVGIDRTVKGVAIAPVREDRVTESSGALHATVTGYPTRAVRIALGLRGDLYGWAVRSRLEPANAGRGAAAMLEPKAMLTWLAGEHLELYADYGESFHSNDARGATIRIDPASGEAAARVDMLVPARGAEIGARLQYWRFNLTLTGFHLKLGSELVFSGDAGTTEPNLASARYGIEATAFWRPADWLTLDAALAWTHARFRGAAAGEDRIPNTLADVASAGAAFRLGGGVSGTLRWRHMGPAPLVEDDSRRARPTDLLNAGLYLRTGAVKLGAEMLNLLDSADADITYFYVSRLPGEPISGVADAHFHPVEPRQVRLSATLSW